MMHFSTGDRGQRYEVTFLDGMNQRCILGWAETSVGVMAMVECVRLHPVWNSPRIIDRKARRTISILKMEKLGQKGKEKGAINAKRQVSDDTAVNDYYLGADGIPCW